MSDKEVIQKAIEKALKNGWKSEIISKNYAKDETISSVDFAVKDIKRYMDLLIGNFIHNPYLLFSHDFAKAFFGDENSEIPTIKRTGVGTFEFNDQENWKAHIQQMILEKNPIDYLRKFIEE